MNEKHIKAFTSIKQDIKDGKVLDISQVKEKLEAEGGEVLPRDWVGLMGYFISDTKLLARHSELIESLDEKVAVKAVELGYKVRGKLQEVPREAVKVTLDFLPKGGEVVIKQED